MNATFKQFECMIFEAVDIALERHAFDHKSVVEDAFKFLNTFVDCRILREDVEYAYDLREQEYIDFLNQESFAYQEKNGMDRITL